MNELSQKPDVKHPTFIRRIGSLVDGSNIYPPISSMGSSDESQSFLIEGHYYFSIGAVWLISSLSFHADPRLDKPKLFVFQDPQIGRAHV